MTSDAGAPPVPTRNPEREGRWTFPIFLDNGRNTPSNDPVLWRDVYGNLVHAPRNIVHMTADAMTISGHSSIRSASTSPFPRPFTGNAVSQEKSEASEQPRKRSLLSTFSSLNILAIHKRKGSLLSNLSNHLNQEEGSVANIYRGLERPVNPQILAPFVLPQGATAPQCMYSQPSRSVARSSSIYSTPSPRLDLEQGSDYSAELPAFLLPRQPVGFWDESLAQTRRQVIFSFARTLLILVVVITLIFSLHAGVLYEVNSRLRDLKVAVVSFEQDTPVLGTLVQSVIEEEIQSSSKHLGFEFISPSAFDNDSEKVRQAVYDQHFWAAIVSDPDATDQTGSIQLVYNSGRDVQAYDSYIVPVLDRIALTISQTSSNTTFSNLDIRPFSPPSALPAITIGLVYLTIASLYSYVFFIHNHMRLVLPHVDNPRPPLKFSHWVIYRWLATIISCFTLAGTYSLVSLAFQIPFNNVGRYSTTASVTNANPFGHGTFPVYCALNFVGIMALGLACENASMFLSTLSATPYSSLFILFWLVANASVSLYPIELANPFYRYGYAMPMKQMVEASKTLILGTRSNLPLNFGILIAWAALGTIVFPLACWLMRWKGIETKISAEREATRMVDDARMSRELGNR